MKLKTLSLLALLFSTPVLAADYECSSNSGASLSLNTLPYMVTILTPRVRPFQFYTHGKILPGNKVSLIGMDSHMRKTGDEIVVDAGMLADSKAGELVFQNNSFQCKRAANRAMGFSAVSTAAPQLDTICDCYKYGDDGHPNFIDRCTISECFAAGGTSYSRCN